MKKIDRGWQYIVYDLGNGRIRKEKNNPIAQFFRIVTNITNPLKVLYWIKRVNEAEKNSNIYIKTILHVIDREILGNPVFIDEHTYEQDKVVVLDKVLKEIPLKDQIETVRKYIELIHTTWTYGFADDVFKFDRNNGLNKQYKVIQLDFGEIVMTIEDVQKQITSKRWMKSYSYRRLPEEVKPYYEDLMNENLTPPILERIWRSKILD